MSGARLTPAERAALHEIAWAAIRDRILGGGELAEVRSRLELTPTLLAPGAAFVTLKAPERPDGPPFLRGCIGTIEPAGPLHETVARFAVESACGDPRFPALVPAELEGLEIEISVLGPLHAIDGPEAIVTGVHGVVLERASHRALFLPQVAVEQEWGLTTFLEHLALKAGLGRDGWRDARLSVFEAEVF